MLVRVASMFLTTVACASLSRFAWVSVQGDVKGLVSKVKSGLIAGSRPKVRKKGDLLVESWTEVLYARIIGANIWSQSASSSSFAVLM